MREISEKRLLFLTAVVMFALTAGSVKFGDWRVTCGVFLGGLLSFLNVWWLKLSLKSLLGSESEAAAPRPFNASLYILRYLTIAIIIALAATFRLVSVAATLVGLLSFAFAILLEAIIQLYFIIVNREDY